MLSLFDIDLVKRLSAQTEGVLGYAELIMDAMHEPVMVLDTAMRVLAINPAFTATFKIRQDQVERKPLSEIAGGDRNIREIRALITDVLPGKQHSQHVVIEAAIGKLGRRKLVLNARELNTRDSSERLVVLAFQPVK